MVTLVASSSCCASLSAVTETLTVAAPGLDGTTTTNNGASVSPAIEEVVQVAVLRAAMHGDRFNDALAIVPFVVEMVAVTEAAGSDPIERTAPEMSSGRRGTVSST